MFIMSKQTKGSELLSLLIFGVVVGFLIIGYSLSEEALGMLSPPEDCTTGWGPCTSEDRATIRSLGFCFLGTGILIVGGCSFGIIMIKTPKTELAVENESRDLANQDE